MYYIILFILRIVQFIGLATLYILQYILYAIVFVKKLPQYEYLGNYSKSGYYIYYSSLWDTAIGRVSYRKRVYHHKGILGYSDLKVKTKPFTYMQIFKGDEFRYEEIAEEILKLAKNQELESSRS